MAMSHQIGYGRQINGDDWLPLSSFEQGSIDVQSEGYAA
jgi:hypothetical protein